MAKVPTKGPNKTLKACALKYGQVCSFALYLRLRELVSFKHNTNKLVFLRGYGEQYLAEHGINVGVAEQPVWDEYVKVHLVMCWLGLWP